MVDGIPTYFESRWNLGDALSDMALFERVEVVRGATGLMTGTGNPSAAINMVRKHATSREFKGDVSAEYGSWNKERYVADLQSPLTEDGKIRARIVGGYQNNDSWLDRYNSEKTFFSGIVDADLGDLTTLSAGYEYQRIDVNSLPGAVYRAGILMAAAAVTIVHAVPHLTGRTTIKRSTRSL